ncbi:MAG TPA: ATP-binding protein [Verrucomicrobiota bacterium]|nr:ATP-binding protein [Verrucomicrobiota bacterium]
MARSFPTPRGRRSNIDARRRPSRKKRVPHIVDLDFEQRLGLLVQRQWLWKSNRALAARLQKAQLKMPATLEDIDYRHPRGLKRAQIEQLRVNDWIGQRRACLITGPTGCGKTYLELVPKVGVFAEGIL